MFKDIFGLKYIFANKERNLYGKTLLNNITFDIKITRKFIRLKEKKICENNKNLNIEY
jgi:hypothetical protein